MKKDKTILVIKRDILFEKDYFTGFMPQDAVDYSERILNNLEYLKRDYVENDPKYKQPIGYCIVINPKTKKIFAYKRAQQELDYSEVRLHGRWSFGLGGHIEKVDNENENPIYAGLLRELKEEIEFNKIGGPKLLGYINYDDDDVGKVHFGILYALETDSEIIISRDSEIKEGKFVSLKDMEEICHSSDLIVEDWSKISLKPIKSYIQSI